jgi:uncharacterized protein (DUF302 family)/uncharacterized membrane protein YidH (DUF202 family)
MDQGAETKPQADIRDYLAAERTLLAWIRTGLALMGFGFVVARFGLFLQELQVAQRVPSLQSYGLSLWFGVALIAMGIAVNLFSAWRHARLIRELNLGEESHYRPSAEAIAVAVILALVGMAMAAYLVSIRSSTNASSSSSSYQEEAPVQAQPAADNGIAKIPSRHTVDETVERLKLILQTKGVTLFALVDHSGEAEKVGLKMLPAKLLIFGSPKAGTPLMVAAPSIALDLPLKILVSQDSEGKVWLSYNRPAYLLERHGVPQTLLPNIAVVEALASEAAE